MKRIFILLSILVATLAQAQTVLVPWRNVAKDGTFATDVKAGAGTTGVTAFGTSLLASANAAAAQSTIALVPGTNVQAYSSTLLSFAGKTVPAGAVVGTTDTQTLTNKSIDAAQLTGTIANARFPAVLPAVSGVNLTSLDSTQLTGTIAAARLPTTGVSAGSYGSATQVGSFTVGVDGRLTTASPITVTPAFSSVTGKPTTLSGFGITDAYTSANLNAMHASFSTRSSLWYDVNTQAPRATWVMGAAGTLGTFPFTQIAFFRVPVTPGGGGYNQLFTIGPAITASPEVSGCVGLLLNDGTLRIQFIEVGASRSYNITGFRSTYVGQWVTLHIVRESAGTLSFYVNGVLQSPTATSTGTPSFSDAAVNLTASNYYIGTRFTAAGSSFDGQIVPFAPILGAMSAAEVLYHVQTGHLPDWCEVGTGNTVGSIASASAAFNVGVGGWTNAGGTSSLTYDGTDSETDFTASSTTFGLGRFGPATLSSSSYTDLIPGAKYRLVVEVSKATSSGTNVWVINNGASAIVTTFPGTVGIQTVDFIAPVSFGINIKLGCSLPGETFSLKSFQIYPLGPIFKPVIQPGTTAYDASTNNIPGVLTDGIKPITGLNHGRLRGILSWSGTHEGKSLFGAKALPVDAVIERIVVKASAASTGSGMTIGTTNTATRYLGLSALTTTKKIYPGSALSNFTPAGTANSDLDLVIDPDTANYTGTIEVVVDYLTSTGAL